MELSSSNIKKIIILSQKKAFLIFPEMESCIFSPSSKTKKIQPDKISYTSGKQNPEKMSYIFLKRKLFLCFKEGNPKKILYISGNGTLLYFRKGIFRTLA